jgi:nicotinamidase-related amidase
MSSVVYLRALSDPSIAPCVVFVDLQKEYVANSRLMAVPEPYQALGHCRAALQHARTMGFPIAHVRQIRRAPFFNPVTDFAAWIKGFEPLGGDMIFDRDKPSCYSNAQFAELMDSYGGHFVLAGFAGETSCLSTAIDAYHRKHKFTYLTDASASHPLGTFSPAAIQNAVSEIIGLYGQAMDTRSWIAANSRIDLPSRSEADA